MYIVAIHHLQGNAQELANNLAKAIGITAYEARARVSVPGGGPALIASFAASEKATECALRLKDAGFDTLVVDSDHMESDLNRLVVKHVQFTSDALQVVTPQEQHIILPYAQINLLLRGAGIISTTQLETSTKKKICPRSRRGDRWTDDAQKS